MTEQVNCQHWKREVQFILSVFSGMSTSLRVNRLQNNELENNRRILKTKLGVSIDKMCVIEMKR